MIWVGSWQHFAATYFGIGPTYSVLEPARIFPASELSCKAFFIVVGGEGAVVRHPETWQLAGIDSPSSVEPTMYEMFEIRSRTPVLLSPWADFNQLFFQQCNFILFRPEARMGLGGHTQTSIPLS
jgi:hypothetical protein